MNEQAVNEPEEQVAKPTGDQEVAQGDDLDSILNEYETETKEEAKPQQQAEIKPEDIEFIKDFQRETARKQTAEDIASAVSMVSDGLDFGSEDLTKEVVEGVLYKRVENDPRMLNAFMSRRQNPSGWSKVLNAVKGELKSKMVDQKTTKDWNALESAVHSANTSKPQEDTPKPLHKMSWHEAQAEKRRIYQEESAKRRKGV